MTNNQAGKLLELADTVERAGLDEQRSMLEQAFSALYPGLSLPAPGRYWPPRSNRFVAMLDAGAFESAAMMLVPEGAHIGMGADATGPLKGWAWVRAKIGNTWEEFSSPPRVEGCVFGDPKPGSIALALLAAALRALTQEHQS